MAKINQLLRQAARITAAVTPQPNTERAIEDHEGVDGKKELAYTTALDGAKKVSTRKQADPSPNVPGDFADDSHKGDAAYQTIYDTDKQKWASRKKAEFPDPAPEEEAVPFEGAAEPEGEAFGGEDEGCEDGSCTNADIVEALEDVKQGIMDAKEEAGNGPAADLLAAIEEVIDAVDSIQNAVSQDAMSDPAAEEAFKTASAFKNFFIKERNIKAAKVIRQALAEHKAATEKKKTATVKKAFDPRVLRNK